MVDRKQDKDSLPEGIVIDDKFRIVYIDDNNLDLQEYQHWEDREGNSKEGFRTLGMFFHRIPAAIKEYARLRQNRAKDISDLLNILKDIDTKIDNVFSVKGKYENRKNSAST